MKLLGTILQEMFDVIRHFNHVYKCVMYNFFISTPLDSMYLVVSTYLGLTLASALPGTPIERIGVD